MPKGSRTPISTEARTAIHETLKKEKQELHSTSAFQAAKKAAIEARMRKRKP